MQIAEDQATVRRVFRVAVCVGWLFLLSLLTSANAAMAGQWVDVGSPIATGRSSAPVSGGSTYGGAAVAGYSESGSSTFRWASPWSPLGGQLPSGGASYVADGPTLYQAASGNVHSWTGTAWSQLGPDYSITNAESGDPLVTLGGVALPRLAWAGAPLVGFQQFVITDTGGGSSSGSHAWFVRRWTGTSWERLSGPDKAGSLEHAWNARGDVTVIDGMPYTCWATRSGNNGSVAVARWTGTSWTKLGTSVVPFAEGSPMCAIRGNGGVPYVLVYRQGYLEIGVHAWNGSGWAAAGVFPADAARTSVSAGSLLPHSGELLAAHVQTVASVATLRVHAFDGETWRAVGATSVNVDPSQPVLYPDLFLADGARHVVFAQRTAPNAWDVRVRRWEAVNDRTATLLPGPARSAPSSAEWVRNTWSGSACSLVGTGLVPAISDDVDAPVSTACSTGTSAHYIEVGTPTAATLAFELGDSPADLSTATSLRVRTRAWKSSGRSAAVSAEVRRADGTLLATAPEFDVTSEQNHSYVIDRLSLTKADVDGLYVVLRSRVTGNGSATRVFVTALNVELDYVAGSAANQRPLAPALDAPVGNVVVDDATPDLLATWSDPDGDDGQVDFQLCAASTCTGSGDPVRTMSIAATTFAPQTIGTIGPAVASGPWFWRARGVDAGGAGPWSSIASFRVDARPDADMVTPAGGAATSDTTPDLVARFLDADAADTGHIDVQVCAAVGCDGPGDPARSGSTGAGIAVGGTGTWSPAALGTGTWYWRVRGVDVHGLAGGWTATRAIRIGSPTMTIVAPSVLALSSPSPGIATTILGTIDITVRTDSAAGYELSLADSSDALALERAGTPGGIVDWSGTSSAPTAWTSGGAAAAGISVVTVTSGKDTSRWGSGVVATEPDGLKWAGARLGSQLVLHRRPSFLDADDITRLAYRADVEPGTGAGTYTASLELTAVALP